MDMLSNGYGCIKRYSKALKQSLFDWILHKFNHLMTRTMSDLPTASTSTSISTASTSSASTSQNNRYMFRLAIQDLDCTTDDSEISSVESDLYDNESISSNNDCISYGETDNNMDDTSWSSAASTVSCGDISSSEISDTEKSVLKERSAIDKSSSIEEIRDDSSTPILILVQPPYETEEEMDEIAINMINVEEHAKRLIELEKEMEYIESTEWMFRPIDASIR